MKPKILVGFIIDGKAGGIDKYILNFFQSVKNDCAVFDFLSNEADADLKKALNNAGSRLHTVSRLNKPKLQYSQVKDLIRQYNYDVVYINISTALSFPALKAAHDCGVKKIIVHSHSAGMDCENFMKRALYTTLHKLYKRKICRYANNFIACSEKAAEWMFTKKILASGRVKYVFNSVDTSLFYPDYEKRKSFREMLGITDKFVIGTVGSMNYVKNHLFLLDVFAGVLKEEPNAALVIIGDGPLMDRIKEKISVLGISDSVILTGRVDVSEGYINAFDVFALPSVFEGLPVVLVEAQCAHIPCVASSNITKSVSISNACQFVALNTALWVNELLHFKDFNRDGIKLNAGSEFDLMKQSRKLKNIIQLS